MSSLINLYIRSSLPALSPGFAPLLSSKLGTLNQFCTLRLLGMVKASLGIVPSIQRPKGSCFSRSSHALTAFAFFALDAERTAVTGQGNFNFNCLISAACAGLWFYCQLEVKYFKGFLHCFHITCGIFQVSSLGCGFRLASSSVCFFFCY